MKVIAHRGASGYRPEHTLASYELAAQMGADFIEPDCVITSDGVLVARHENEISGTTDVADRPEFADRRTTKVVDGEAKTGWFAEDFTLEEIKTLRARERIPKLRPANTEYDGRFEIPTLREVIEVAERFGVGVYPETKHPSHFRTLGLPLEPPLLEELERTDVPVFIQSFEDGNLRELRGRTKMPLVQLVPQRRAHQVTPDGLAEIAAYADAIGPAKELIVPRGEDGRSLATTTVVDDAHEVGLEVHPFTFRSENAFLPLELRRGGDRAAHGDAESEYVLFRDLGVDAVFSDFADVAVAIRA